MLLRARILFVLACLLLTGCDSRSAREAEQLALYPKGQIFNDVEKGPPAAGRGLPECLRAPGAVIGWGVCVPLEQARPDGAHDAPRWGIWTYEYVRTTQTTSPDGKVLTHFGDVEDSSLGIEAQGEYRADKLVGTWKYWHPNGKQRAIGEFVDSEMTGEWKFWLPTGAVDEANSGVYEHDVRKSPLPAK